MKTKLDSAFESWGYFWPVDCDAQRTPGRLTYSPDDGIVVELAGSPTNGAFDIPIIPTFYGRLVSGTTVTLANCFIKKIGAGFGAFGLPTTVHVGRLLIGAHASEIDQLQVRKIAVELSSVSNWTGTSPLKSSFRRANDGAVIGHDVSYTRPESINAPLPEQNLCFGIRHGGDAREDHGSVAIHWSSAFTLEADKSVCLSDMQGHAMQCQHLLTLLIGHQTSARHIECVTADSGSVQLVYRQVGRHDHRDVQRAELLIPYCEIREEFPRIVDKWFSRTRQAILAANIFFGSQSFETIPLDLRFLSMTQAAESYHRSAGDGTYMDPEQYEVAIRPFLAQLLPGFEEDHRRSLNNRLKYGNEYSLRKRLTTLCRRLPSELQSDIVKDVSTFVDRVVDTRNYLTHFDHASEASSMKNMSLLVAAHRLRFLIMAHCLCDLGIQAGTVVSALRRNPEYCHWTSKSLSL